MAQLRKNVNKHISNSAFGTPPAQINLDTVPSEVVHPGWVDYFGKLINVFRFLPWEKNPFYQTFFNPGRGAGKAVPKYSNIPEVIAPEDPGFLPPPDETFKGWTFNLEDLTSEIYAPGETVPLTDFISNLFAFFGKPEVKITYWANNGTEDSHSHYGDLGTHWLPVQLFNPSDPRLNFLGWDKDLLAEKGSIKGIFTLKGKAVNYYSIWSHSIIELYANNGSEDMKYEVIDTDKIYTLPSSQFDPPYSWEYFIGWGYNEDGPVIPTTTIPIEGLVKLYSQWDQYSLSFDPNGGEGTMAPIKATSEYFTLPICSFAPPAGKIFEGWSYTPNGEIITETQIKADKNITLYAKYRAIVIHFNAGDGSGIMADAKLTAAWFLLPHATFTPPLKKHFIGWSYTPNGEVIPEEIITPTEDTTLYAIYDYNHWKISFSANGGVGTKDPIIITEGYFDIPENTFFTPPDGKRYIGWALNGSDKPLDTNHIYVDRDITIFAIYGNIVVSYNANGGTGTQRDRILDSWTFVVPRATTFIAPAKKHFAGWAYTPTGEIIKTETIQVIDNITLYAVWEDNVWMVQLDANGGQGEAAPVTMPEGNYTLPYYCPFTPPDGKRFLGWSRMRTEPVIGEETIYINSDTTLYAIYIKVKVSFNPGAGTGAMVPMYLNSWEYELPPCEFTPPPTYRFEGWAYSLTGDIITTPKILVKADTTLYAKYVTDYVDVKFDANGGGGTMDTMKVIRTVNFELPENKFTPPDDTMKFIGWKVEELGDVIYQPGDEVAIKSNYGTTVFALWDTLLHTASFDANGGTGVMDPVVVDEREKYQLPEVEFTPPEHEHPIGWAYDPDGPVIEDE